MSRYLEKILSAERLSTYKKEMGGDLEKAIRLYQWNAEISGAFLPVLQVLEVSIRNAVSEAISSVYGNNWVNEKLFILSLPDNKFMRKQLKNSIEKHSFLTGKIIADMNFIFWQNMFTKRFTNNIWNKNFSKIFPNAPATLSISSLYYELDDIRTLRNRIAHHEPIFRQDLDKFLDRILKIILYRDKSTYDWVKNNQTVIAVLARKPLK